MARAKLRAASARTKKHAPTVPPAADPQPPQTVLSPAELSQLQSLSESFQASTARVLSAMEARQRARTTEALAQALNQMGEAASILARVLVEEQR